MVPQSADVTWNDYGCSFSGILRDKQTTIHLGRSDRCFARVFGTRRAGLSIDSIR